MYTSQELIIRVIYVYLCSFYVYIQVYAEDLLIVIPSDGLILGSDINSSRGTNRTGKKKRDRATPYGS